MAPQGQKANNQSSHLLDRMTISGNNDSALHNSRYYAPPTSYKQGAIHKLRDKFLSFFTTYPLSEA